MLIEMRNLAAEGVVLLSDDAFALFNKAQAEVVDELDRLQADLSRDSSMLKCLLNKAEAAWVNYLQASDEAMEHLK